MTEQLTPEDEARIARIEARTAARAEEEAEGEAGARLWLSAIGAVALLFFMAPLISIWLGGLPLHAVPTVMSLVPFSLAMMAGAAVAWRRGRFRLPNGRVYEGRVVRIGAVAAVAGPLLLALLWDLAAALLAPLGLAERLHDIFL